MIDNHTPPGTKIVFSNPTGGLSLDQEKATKHLVVGKTYTVQRTDEHSWHTNVYLAEVPDQYFNSVHFSYPGGDDTSEQE